MSRMIDGGKRFQNDFIWIRTSVILVDDDQVIREGLRIDIVILLELLELL